MGAKYEAVLSRRALHTEHAHTPQVNASGAAQLTPLESSF